MIGDGAAPRQDERVELAHAIYHRSKERWRSLPPTVIIGRHARLATALDRLHRFAEADSPVLITGETGTGKELFARGLYLLCRRVGRPFVRVNCAQYHDGHLIASELFGHRKGSFTGAIDDHVGLFESAHTGVLFLDEVAELTMPAQAMLLRVLSEGELVPVGETVPRHTDVRVVAASSQDLGRLVHEGQFRRDLYYRLRSLHIQVPAVRERGDDWMLVREYYLRQLVQSKARAKRFSDASIDVLSRYDWPGNVRELKALVETGFHLSEGEIIEPCHFLEALEEAGRLQQIGKIPIVDIETRCYEQMVNREGNFWQIIRDAYKNHELSRNQVRAIIGRGLVATRGSYKRLLPLFGLEDSEYLPFMDFLRHHKLKPGR
jgi:DNA-binding NtrC family response regulator